MGLAKGSGALKLAPIARKMERFPTIGTIVNVLFVNPPVAAVKSAIEKGGRVKDSLPGCLYGYILST